MFYICMWHLVLNTGHVVRKCLSTESECYRYIDLTNEGRGRDQSRVDKNPGGRGACSSFFAKIFENNDETVTLK